MSEDFVAVVLDVVGSRARPDPTVLLAGVARRSEQVLVAEGSAVSAGATVGDEVQALYRDVGAAVLDVARLRLSLLLEPPAGSGPAGPVELRAGFGVGQLDTASSEPDATAPGQSGTAWWHARSAIEVVDRPRNAWPLRRWWVEGDDDVRALQATLLALDTLLAGFDDADRTAAVALLDGAAAGDVATRLGVTASTVSARLHGHGVYGVVRTLQTLAA